jgi:N-acetylmuramoyl-L-alanine amidase
MRWFILIYLWTKKRCLVLIFVLTFLVIAFSCTNSLAAGNTGNIKQGMSGSNVLQLQKDLKSLGYLNAKPTGFFGESTKTAVLSFQKKYKIPATGVAGPLTLTHINTLLKRSSTPGNQKKSIKIVIDAGHGGIDPGAKKGNVVEKEVTLDISKMLRSYLEEKNYDTIMTRTKDVSLYKQSSRGGTIQLRDLNARVKLINNSSAKIFVSIHVNSLPENPSQSGSIVFYNSRSTKSKALALSIQKSLNNMTVNGRQRHRNGIQKANFYVLKNANIPGVLVETAFVTNKTERNLLSEKSFRDKVARAILAGIENSDVAG